jgi:hypothetical protein
MASTSPNVITLLCISFALLWITWHTNPKHESSVPPWSVPRPAPSAPKPHASPTCLKPPTAVNMERDLEALRFESALATEERLCTPPARITASQRAGLMFMLFDDPAEMFE